MSEPELLFANERFYRAFIDRDMAAMEQIWADDAPCACLHPGWPPLVGRNAILESWQRIFAAGGPVVSGCVAAQAHSLGDSGYVICYEQIGSEYVIVTNMFTREPGGWRLVHHQGGPVEPPQAVAHVAPKPAVH